MGRVSVVLDGVTPWQLECRPQSPGLFSCELSNVDELKTLGLAENGKPPLLFLSDQPGLRVEFHNQPEPTSFSHRPSSEAEEDSCEVNQTASQ